MIIIHIISFVNNLFVKFKNILLQMPEKNYRTKNSHLIYLLELKRKQINVRII